MNFGPTEGELSVRDMLAEWGRATATPPDWRAVPAPPMAEKPRLALDSRLARDALGWTPRLTTRAAVAATAGWYAAWAAGQDMATASDATIRTYLEVP